jgi:hypothetical protein
MEGLEYYDEESMNDAMNDALNYGHDEYDYPNYDENYENEKSFKYYLNNCDLTEYEEGINEMYRESDKSFYEIAILEYTKITHSTKLAFLIARIDNKKGETEFWIPKSICKLKEEDNLIAIPMWIID